MSFPEDLDRIELIRERMAKMQHVHAELLEDAAFDAPGYFALLFSKDVYSHRLAEWEQTYAVPKNWFQHLLATLGLKHKTVTHSMRIVRRRIYPDLPVLPGDKFGVSFIREDRA